MTQLDSSSALVALDRAEIERRKRRLAGALDDDGTIDPFWLRERGWTAVPFEAPMDDADAERLARATAGLGATHCYAVALEEGFEEFGIRFPPDPDAILEADAACSMRETVWAPDNGSFLLRGDGDLYFIVAGPQAFLRGVSGGPIDEAREAFDAYARDPELTSEARTRLQDLARTLAGLSVR